MFDVSPLDIGALTDADLRTLIGLLAEAELRSLGYSSSAVTYGGNQDATDGGFDVSVSLDSVDDLAGYIPRGRTAFQVKATDMLPSLVAKEMRPHGVLRPSIAKLAVDNGAYIIASSGSSTTDTALARRRDAMRACLKDTRNGSGIFLDFYDRTRIATWVRSYPGIVAWVLERRRGTISGWHPWGAWAGGGESSTAEYLLDDSFKLHFGLARDENVVSVEQGIARLREQLGTPRSVCRLVGLSGVGKTRLVQALFDSRVGAHPIPPSMAIYANVGETPYPSPASLASEFVTNRTRAVLIVDNCAADLHQTLLEIVRAPDSELSLLTVEYDIRDDQAEGTSVITLEPSSDELIDKLVRRRFPLVSQVDSRAIAAAAGGNARVALAIASTVGKSENIGGLTDDQLFARLFYQRRLPDESFFRASQVVSLVYSFDGETQDGPDAELPLLASLAGQSLEELYRHVASLHERDLLQRRGRWRALLPHAVANKLAKSALKSIPWTSIERTLLNGPPRILKSFSHRLSFLAGVAEAEHIASRWLTESGLLGNVDELNELGRYALENVAPVAPDAVLEALERAAGQAATWRHYVGLLRSLAYDPRLFHRSVALLADVARATKEERSGREAADVLSSLMQLYLSGTHASAEQRLIEIRRLIDNPADRDLGTSLFEAYLKADHFSSSYSFDFGGRSRDYGYYPKTTAEFSSWFRLGLDTLATLREQPELVGLVKRLLARSFRDLWRATATDTDRLDRLVAEISQEDYWANGWLAVRQTIHFDKNRMPSELLARLRSLETALSPKDLTERVKALVLGEQRDEGLDEDFTPESWEASRQKKSREAEELGTAVASAPEVQSALVDLLVVRGKRQFEFGVGLAKGSQDHRSLWWELADSFFRAGQNSDATIFRGIIAGLSQQFPDVAEELLDQSLRDRRLKDRFPLLQTAIPLNERGVRRILLAISDAEIPTWAFRHLAFGRRTEEVSGRMIREITSGILGRADGFKVALEVLGMRIFGAKTAPPDEEIVAAGIDILTSIDFTNLQDVDDYHLAELAKYSLRGDDGGQSARQILDRMGEAVASHKTYYERHDGLLREIFALQPLASLDSLERHPGPVLWRMFDDVDGRSKNPLDVVPVDLLIRWCEIAPTTRYELAACAVSIEALEPGADGQRLWSPHALALLLQSPEKAKIATQLIERFHPSGWSGSLAAILERRLSLLDQLAAIEDAELMSLSAAARANLVRAIDTERLRETRSDRKRDERFE